MQGPSVNKTQNCTNNNFHFGYTFVEDLDRIESAICIIYQRKEKKEKKEKKKERKKQHFHSGMPNKQERAHLEIPFSPFYA